MKIIVGLGNPGEKYEQTRHNLGFMALEELLRKLESAEKTFWENNKDLKSDIKQIKYNDTTLLLIKPTTFMNDSGFSVSKVLNYYKIDSADMVVIHDDLDMPFGKIRVRFGGGTGGHKGVESIIGALGTDKFLRVRLGIGNLDTRQPNYKPQSSDTISDYVLGTIASSERGKVKTMLREAVRTTELILEHGIDSYMSKYNR